MPKSACAFDPALLMKEYAKQGCLLPIPMLLQPLKPTTRSHRVRERYHRRYCTWMLAAELLEAVNSAYEGLRVNTKEVSHLPLNQMAEPQQRA